ncbi:MAG: YidC/Oxa1 family insertase periplasmic-domain containing protein [Planctomycetota bacterium]|jgi:YidC/Oxa1 family membrane protein insertase
MRIALTLVVIAFVLFCGWLIVESGLFDGSSQTGRDIILLQNVADNQESETPNAPESDIQQLKAVDSITVGADNAPAKTITLGSVDPKSGYKFQLELSSKGAAIRKATFSEFDDRDHKNPQPLVIISPIQERDGSEVLTMANTGFQNDALIEQKRALPLDKFIWKSFDKVIEDDSQTVRFEAVFYPEDANDQVFKMTKTYKITSGSYLLECNITVENLSDSEQKVRFSLSGPGGLGREAFRTDMRKIVGGFAISKADKADEAEVVSSKQGISSAGFIRRTLGLKDAVAQYQQALRTGNKTQIDEAWEKLRIGHNLPDQYGQADFLWAAAVNKYFAAILVPLPDEGKVYCDWVADKTGWFHNPDGDRKADSGDETIGLDLKIASNTLAESGRAESLKTYNFQLYLGPKDKSLFDKDKLYQKYGFVHTIEFMGCCCPGWIIKPLAFGILAIMKWMYGFIHNYGVVIIILVFLMRLAMHPITKKSQVSMSKMSKLAPKAEEIKKKYTNNKAEMNKQMMALYREQGASPVMGFLPMMVQMPIWIALWSAVYASIDLRGAVHFCRFGLPIFRSRTP